MKKKKEHERDLQFFYSQPKEPLKEEISFVEKYGVSPKDFLRRFSHLYSMYLSILGRKKPFKNGETVEQRTVQFIYEMERESLPFEIFEDVKKIRNLEKSLE